MIPSFKRIKSSIDDLNLVQDAVDAVLRVIRIKDLLDGRLISDLILDHSVVNTIDHGLEKPIRGWFVVRKDANSDIWESISEFPSKQFNLNATADVTVSLWVF